jgi:hypothetical protein
VEIAASRSRVDNVEHLSYNASSGTYFLIVEIAIFNHDPQARYEPAPGTCLNAVGAPKLRPRRMDAAHSRGSAPRPVSTRSIKSYHALATGQPLASTPDPSGS